METRRFLTFIALSALFLFAWTKYVAPKFFPPPKPVAQKAAEPEAKAQPNLVVKGERQPLVAERPRPEDAREDNLPRNEPTQVILGSLEPDTGYFLQVDLTSQGAAVKSIRLNDPKFKELTNLSSPLTLVQERPEDNLRTFQTAIPEIDELLTKQHGVTLNLVDWQLAGKETDDAGVIHAARFVFSPPGQHLKLTKTYRIHQVPGDDPLREAARKTETAGYLLDMDLTIENTSAQKPQTVHYVMQGPVGVPLENAENTRKYRDIRVGFLREDGSVSHEMRTAEEIVEAVQDEKLEQWSDPLAYLGIDVQYFATLLHPARTEGENPYVGTSHAQLLQQTSEEARSEVSVEVASRELTLAPRSDAAETTSSVTHSWQLYAGPKREALLAQPLQADSIMDYGWFGAVSRLMVKILAFLNGIGLPYWLAIICLTVMVRGAMFPLSIKQAMGAQKMKELQPEIAALRERYKNNKEKLAQAQMELFRKHKYNPLAGCFPVLLQMPIFIGLYWGLNVAVDLRLAEFLWIENLAAPDSLFNLPFSIPFLGASFNLLPIITIGLFIYQQKKFMPPASNPEEEMQQKMMSYMMIFMGFMFYHVPAGLCLYFIASSLWGLAERQLLEKFKSRNATTTATGTPAVVTVVPGSPPSAARPTKRKSKR